MTSAPTVHEEATAPTLREPPPRPERLLVADDEHLVAAGLKSNLIDLGYVVVGPASTGEDAVELARTTKPDMALLDIRMPHKDGLEAGEIIFKQFGIPVVMISAFSDPEYLSGCNKFNAFGYILKPVTQDELRVTIDVAWNRFADYCRQQDQIERLKERLEHRKIIEQAKWLLVKRKGIAEPDAMKLLQKQARNNRRTLIDVARSILENEVLFSEK